MIKSIKTRFRAYQLGSPGSSFSYFSGNHFTLIEARLTELNKPNIEYELEQSYKKNINVLHITSWDQDHCSVSQLEEILKLYSPEKIEYPGYLPHTDSGKDSLKVIKAYERLAHKPKCIQVTPGYIKSLNSAEGFGYNNILYHPKYLSDNANDNSTVKLFRTGCFNVLSLGDVENSNLSASLRRIPSIQNEVDVMILAHHGADNGFTSSSFIKHVKPKVAICSSDYSNQYDHPRQEIRDLLYHNEVDLFTTKTGDIIVSSLENHQEKYRVTNLISNSEKVSRQIEYSSKKHKRFSVHQDNIQARYKKSNRP